jgi:DNA end-binding protein Ku
MHYQQDILPRDDMAPPAQKLTAAEQEMAVKLVQAMTTTFKPAEYKDEYTLALKKMVDDKLKGVEIKTPEIEKIEFEDLMTALKQSVLAASGKR